MATIGSLTEFAEGDGDWIEYVERLEHFFLANDIADKGKKRKCELIQLVDDDDFIYRVVTPSVRHGALGSPTAANQAEGILQDFILLASKRKPCGSGDPYVIALRSVSLPTHPPTEGYNRGEVLCAGFTILDTKDNKSLITYFNQASPEDLPYICTDIAGLSSSFYHNFCSCSRYLTRNRL